MPCEQCENGKVKWGKTGSCEYDSIAECEEANKDYYETTTQREIISPALIPEKSIYRYDADTDSDYYVFFSKDTVKKCAYSYLKNNNHHKATYQHQDRVSGVLTVESWIKEGDSDKSKLYGYDLPSGTWFVKMTITNDDLWEKVKSGDIKGLSIEGFFTSKYEAMQKTEPTNEEILSALNDIINENQTESK